VEWASGVVARSAQAVIDLPLEGYDWGVLFSALSPVVYEVVDKAFVCRAYVRICFYLLQVATLYAAVTTCEYARRILVRAKALAALLGSSYVCRTSFIDASCHDACFSSVG